MIPSHFADKDIDDFLTRLPRGVEPRLLIRHGKDDPEWFGMWMNLVERQAHVKYWNSLQSTGKGLVINISGYPAGSQSEDLDRLRWSTDVAIRIASLRALDGMAGPGNALQQFELTLLREHLAQRKRNSAASWPGTAPNFLSNVTVPILLVDRGSGYKAELTLHLVDAAPAAGPPWQFARAPSSYLLLPDAAFLHAMSQVEHMLAEQVIPLPGHAGGYVVWDLHLGYETDPDKRELLDIKDRSAGASFALATLWLLVHGGHRLRDAGIHALLVDLRKWPPLPVTACLPTRGHAVSLFDPLDGVRGMALKSQAAQRNYLTHVLTTSDHEVLPHPPPVDILTVSHLADAVHSLHRFFMKRQMSLHGMFRTREQVQVAQACPSGEFVERLWLTQAVDAKVTELREHGGVVRLEAPRGWGKTVHARQWVATPPGQPGALTSPLGGWGFTYDTGNSGATSSSAALAWAIEELDAATRSNLDLPRRTGAGERTARETWRSLLDDAGYRANVARKPIVLLLDGGDTSFAAIEPDLPHGWPARVILIHIGVPEPVRRAASPYAPLQPQVPIEANRFHSDLARFLELRGQAPESRAELVKCLEPLCGGRLARARTLLDKPGLSDALCRDWPASARAALWPESDYSLDVDDAEPAHLRARFAPALLAAEFGTRELPEPLRAFDAAVEKAIADARRQRPPTQARAVFVTATPGLGTTTHLLHRLPRGPAICELELTSASKVIGWSFVGPANATPTVDLTHALANAINCARRELLESGGSAWPGSTDERVLPELDQRPAAHRVQIVVDDIDLAEDFSARALADALCRLLPVLPNCVDLILAGHTSLVPNLEAIAETLRRAGHTCVQALLHGTPGDSIRNANREAAHRLFPGGARSLEAALLAHEFEGIPASVAGDAAERVLRSRLTMLLHARIVAAMRAFAQRPFVALHAEQDAPDGFHPSMFFIQFMCAIEPAFHAAPTPDAVQASSLLNSLHEPALVDLLFRGQRVAASDRAQLINEAFGLVRGHLLEEDAADRLRWSLAAGRPHDEPWAEFVRAGLLDAIEECTRALPHPLLIDRFTQRLQALSQHDTRTLPPLLDRSQLAALAAQDFRFVFLIGTTTAGKSTALLSLLRWTQRNDDGILGLPAMFPEHARRTRRSIGELDTVVRRTSPSMGGGSSSAVFIQDIPWEVTLPNGSTRYYLLFEVSGESWEDFDQFDDPRFAELTTRVAQAPAGSVFLFFADPTPVNHAQRVGGPQNGAATTRRVLSLLTQPNLRSPLAQRAIPDRHALIYSKGDQPEAHYAAARRAYERTEQVILASDRQALVMRLDLGTFEKTPEGNHLTHAKYEDLGKLWAWLLA